MGALDELLDKLDAMPPKQVASLMVKCHESSQKKKWIPNPGPQTEAYLSEADVLLFGGRAGGGKSHLELGWAINEAESAIIFRRELNQTEGLEREGIKIIGTDARFNGQDREWVWKSGKSLRLGGMKMPDDWMAYAGRERDLMCFDEAGEFLEQQVAAIKAWLRASPGKRTRMILASNPPRTSEGLWLIKWFAPWLDKTFHNPALPGELRYAVHVSDPRAPDEIKVIWVDGPGTYTIEGEDYAAKSFTFIPATLDDNPYRNTPEYKAELQSLPEPLRSQLLYGDFSVGHDDESMQVIPALWVRAAMDRWTDRAPPGVPMCAIGVDCSGGGKDPMVQAPRYDGWFAPLIKTPGKDIPQDKPGSFAAGLVLSNRLDNALVVVDMGGGYGGPLYEHLRANDIEAMPYKGAEATTRRAKDGKLGFTNTRSAAYWLFREALSPDQPGGSPIRLPPDQRLMAGLTAPRFEITPQGIKVEPKVSRDSKGRVTGGVMYRLGFSPDEADAVVQSWFSGPRMTTNALDWMDMKAMRRVSQPKSIGGARAPLSARRYSKG